MSAAEDRRDELEAVIRRSATVKGKDGKPFGMLSESEITVILAAADDYAKAAATTAVKKAAARRAARAAKATGRDLKVPALHLASPKGRAACRAGDGFSARWPLTTVAEDVTCGHCRKTRAWQEAGEPRLAVTPGPGEPS